MAPQRVVEEVVVDCWSRWPRGVVRVAGRSLRQSASEVWIARWVTVAQ